MPYPKNHYRAPHKVGAFSVSLSPTENDNPHQFYCIKKGFGNENDHLWF
jgi:hypothetical protein